MFDLEQFNKEHAEKLRKIAQQNTTARREVAMPKLTSVSLDEALKQNSTQTATTIKQNITARNDGVDEPLEALAARKQREQMQHKLAQATERAIAGKTRQNAQKRGADAQARFFRKMVEIASFRDERGHFVEPAERAEALRKIRSTYAAEGCQRANLASRHSADKRQGAILTILNGLMTRYKQRYCFPSQECIQWMLWRHFGVLVSISTLNNDLQSMDDLGLITRKRRHARIGGKFSMASTLYLITTRGHSFRKSAQKLFSLLVSTVFQKIGEYMVEDKSSKEKKGRDKQKDSPSGELEGGDAALWVEQWEFI